MRSVIQEILTSVFFNYCVQKGKESDIMMDIGRIKSLLETSSSTILSAESFSERLNVIYDILDKEFPPTTVAAAVYGPITSLTDYMSREEIDPLLQVIEKSSKTAHEYMITDRELNEVLNFIYAIVKE